MAVRVVGVQQWAEIRRMVLVERRSQREVALRMGLARDTVARAVRSEVPPRYVRARAGSKLDPLKSWIWEQLRADPRIPSQRLRELAGERGYAGGKTIFDDYAREVPPRFLAKRTFQRTPRHASSCPLTPGRYVRYSPWRTPNRRLGIKRGCMQLGVTLAVGLVLGAILGAVRPSPAFADCSSESEIFWGNWSQAGNWQNNSYGSDNNIVLRNRTISGVCQGLNAGSTSFLNVNGAGTYSEVGWEEDNGSLGRYWQWFGEWYIDGVLKGRPTGSYPCTLNFGDVHRWRVKNVSGTTKFDLLVDCQDGRGFRRLATTDAMISDNQGLAEGETWRFADAGMADDHRTLEWLQGNGTWHDWNEPRCDLDNASGFKGQFDSSTRYEVVSGTMSC